MNKILFKTNTKIITGILIMSFILTFCPAFNEVQTAKSATKTVTVTYPITVKDHGGTLVRIAKKPVRIVSLTLVTDEMLATIVTANRFKALDIFSTDGGISNVAKWANNNTVKKIVANLETVISLKPDLVFVADWKEKEFVQQLRDARIPVYVFKTPTNFSELFKALKEISYVVGVPLKGQAMVKSIKKKLNYLWRKDKLRSIERSKRKTVLSYSFYGSTYGKGTSFDALVNKAGLVNVATRAGLSGWPNLSKEEVIRMNPDIVILPSWSYQNTMNAKAYLDNFKKDPSFKNLKAVKNNKVFIITDRYMQTNSQYMINGVLALAKKAYPRFFK